MLSKLIFYSFSLFALIGAHKDRSGRALNRNKRYLVYPDGGPARAQFIIGLGVPVDLQEQTVTVGTVIKFQYDLPTNSTQYTSRIYGFANTVVDSRDMNEADSKEVDSSENYSNKQKEAYKHKNFKNINLEENDGHTTEFNSDITRTTSQSDSNDNDNDTLVDIVFEDYNKERTKRALYMEGGADLQANPIIEQNELPLEEAIERQEKLDEAYLKQDPEMRRTNRWDLYRIMEMMAEKYGYSGRPCMLRTVCEAAEIPFTHKNGLLGEITHILFTPSTTKDALSHHTDNEYHAAERLGRSLDVDCESLFPECEASLLETFTQVGIETLHKFGF